MDYKFSHFIYPILKPICLSNYFNFYLDNPRTKEEIKDIAIKLANSRQTSYFRLIAQSKNDFSGAEKYLLGFKDHFLKIDPYVLKVFHGYKSEKILEYIAKLWLVIRFDDADIRKQSRTYARKMKKEGKHGFIMPDDSHPAIRNQEILKEYSALLSLLAYDNSEETYNGQNILMQEYTPRQDDDFWFIFMWFCTAAPQYSNNHLDMLHGWDWLFYPSMKNNLLETAKLLDDAFNKGASEKLLYIGNLLHIAGQETHDPKVQILLLTSILELMLTHNPDFNRFNVEDSINKQFQLKITTLMKIMKPDINLSETKESLKKIYSVRSSIAHGNFGELSKVLKSVKGKNSPDEMYPLDTISSSLYVFVKEVIKAYLTDKEFVEFLKQA